MNNIRIVDLNKETKTIERYIENNGYPGKSIGFYCIDQHYTHKDGGVTDWTGFPSSGKTYFVLEVLFNLANRYGKRTALYLPDMGSYIDLVSKLVKMYTGKDFSNRYGNKISLPALYNSIPFLTHHFPIIDKVDSKKPLRPTDIWEWVADFKDDDGGVIHNVLIDSWKNLYHDLQPFQGREYAYLDSVLSYRNEIALKYNRHFHTIAHAVKTELNEETTSTGKKKRRIPDANDIKGGSAWYANGLNIATVDRPDKQGTGVDIYFSKTKPEDVGREGAVIGKIFLDPKRGRYYEQLPTGLYYPCEGDVKDTRLQANMKFDSETIKLNDDEGIPF